MAYNPNDATRLKHTAQLAQVVKSNQDDLLADISGKVDKVNGKGLSTNDYTTTEKNKLAGIADNANNYSLPVATTSTIGGVKVDSVANSNIVLSSGGNISVPAASTSQAGVVKYGGGTTNYLRADGAWATPPNTTYAVATSSANGLMSANDKKTLDSVPSVYETKANAITAVTVDGQKLTFTKGNGSTVTLQTQDTNTDTNTHYTTKLIVGASNSTVNAATTNGNTYIRLFDDTTARESHKISGSGATTVTSDSNGNIVVNSTNTTYAVATSSANGLMSANDKKTLDSVPSVYANLTGAQTISGNKTFTGATVIYSKSNTKPSQGQGLFICGADANEGGQVNLCAPDSGTTFNGIILDNYQGNLRIFGIPSADGSTRTGIGTILYINPYTKTITGGYTFTGDVTGNCSGSSGSCTGNAATATKWANAKSLKVSLASSAAQTINGTADATVIGVAGILPIANGGTGTTTQLGIYNNIRQSISCIQRLTASADKPWFKVASIIINGTWMDASITFMVNTCLRGAGGGNTWGTGILVCHVSTSDTKPYLSELQWLVCAGFDPSYFRVKQPTVFTDPFEIWCYVPSTYQGYRFTVLDSSESRTGTSLGWTLYTNLAGYQATAPSGGTITNSSIVGSVYTATKIA